MKKARLNILIASLTVVLLLTGVLCVHIYQVTKPKADENTIAMARIDFKQDINSADAAIITSWLYKQKGVSHVYCNPETEIAVFTFYPVKASASEIAENLQSALHYKSARFIPTASQLKGGCPVSTTSFSYRLYSYIKNIFS